MTSIDERAASPLATLGASRPTAYEALACQRRSIRGYKREAVPRAVIDEVIAVATQAPSSMNTQPWHFHVVTGEPLERIRLGNTERMVAGAQPDREIAGHGRYEGAHRDRRKEIAADLLQSSVVREHARVPEDEVIETRVALGYPEQDFAANDVKSNGRQGWRRTWGSRTEVGAALQARFWGSSGLRQSADQATSKRRAGSSKPLKSWSEKR